MVANGKLLLIIELCQNLLSYLGVDTYTTFRVCQQKDLCNRHKGTKVFRNISEANKEFGQTQASKLHPELGLGSHWKKQ